MANLPISGLTASASNLAATDVTPVVQTTGVGPVKMTGLQIAGGLLGSTALTGATVTTSQPVLNLSQTWNASGVTFTGLKFNATDTASASGSLLLDLQVGGSSKLYVNKAGDIYTNGAQITRYVDASRLDIGGSFTNGIIYASATTLGIGANSASAVVSTGFLGSAQFRAYKYVIGNGTSDLFLTRGNTATLQLGDADAAAPVAQTFKVQSVVAGTSNTAGTNFTIQGSQGTGTGAGGSIIFQVAPAGSSGSSQNAYSTALTIASDRNATFANSVNAVFFNCSNTYLGNAIDVTGNIVTNGSKYLGSSGRYFFYSLSDGVVEICGASLTGTGFGRLQFGGTTSSFPALKRVSANLQVIAADNTASAGFIVGNQALATAATDGFLYIPTCAGTPTGTPTTQTGTAPIVVDTTNNKLYFYSGGQWRDAGP